MLLLLLLLLTFVVLFRAMMTEPLARTGWNHVRDAVSNHLFSAVSLQELSYFTGQPGRCLVQFALTSC